MGRRTAEEQVTLPVAPRALVLPLMLAVVAGFVDAVGFLELFGVFPANQSGNAIVLGLSVSDNPPAPAWASGGAIAGFMVGTGFAFWLAGRLAERHRRTVLLAIELALLVALAVAVAQVDTGPDLLPPGWRAVLILVASTAMGVQTEVIRRTAGVAVATTYQSGAIVRIGESLATLPGTAARADAVRLLSVLVAVLVAYVGGAAAGAGLGGDGRTALVAPCVLLAIVIACLHLRPAWLVAADR
ncbi:MAG: DUF1275 domain-containing protein [Acidimicrobiia bacterium]|nr:DUF1275 domain-containing protein [Acidimicrobiia bacterium]